MVKHQLRVCTAGASLLLCLFLSYSQEQFSQLLLDCIIIPDPEQESTMLHAHFHLVVQISQEPAAFLLETFHVHTFQ